MSLNLNQKKAIVADVAAVAARAHSAIAAEYAGLTVADMTRLRSEARGAGVYVRVVKNTLARLALENTKFDCMRDGLVGPLLLAFSEEDPGAAARVLSSFVKTNDKLVVKLVAVEGRMLAPEDIKALATLPTRDQALSQLLGVMKAPIGLLARTLAEPHAKLVRTVAAVGDQKQAA